jgi:hypothetical protein
MNWDAQEADISSEMRVVQESGATVFRMGMDLNTVRAKGWIYYDNVFTRAWEHGITILPGIYDGPRFLRESDPDWGSSAWYIWAREAVERYGINGTFWQTHSSPGMPARPVTAWEVGNEPNLPEHNPNMTLSECEVVNGKWSTSDGNCVAPLLYGRFLSYTSSAIATGASRRGQTRPTILFGVLLLWKGNWQVFLEGAGHAASYDAVSIHPYSLVAGSQLSTFENYVDSVRTALDHSIPGDANKPLWVTEFGWPAADNGISPTDNFPKNGVPVDETEQASLLTRSIAWLQQVAATDKIAFAAWFNVRDYVPWPQELAWDGYCGLRKRNGEYRPAWRAFQAAAGVEPWPIHRAKVAIVPSGVGWNGFIWRGSDGNIYETHAPGGTWQSYALTWFRHGIPDGVRPVSDPIIVSSENTFRGVIWVGSDGNLYETHGVNGEWQSYALTWSKKGIPSGVRPIGDPVIAPSETGMEGVLWRGSDGNIYETRAPDGDWESYALTWFRNGIPPGIEPMSDPVVLPSATGWEGVIWRGSDGNIYETHGVNGEWETFSPTWLKNGIPSGVTTVAEPVITHWGSGWDSVAWIGSDGNIYDTHAPSGDWETYSPTWSKDGIPPGVSPVLALG